MKESQKIEPLQVPAKTAAEMLSYSLRTFNSLVYSGEIKPIKSGKLRRFSIEQLKQWQTEHSA